ncbi:hypothetical protein IAR55_005094 [Kwoniella newhampshirensis]|uniref:Zn(2)-C6 fungal-type domain-containing protein n=1 Tax=Kwoniella newhampshirensis TaxID=1651941 RepID=A0AAW0YXC0_9TREE
MPKEDSNHPPPLRRGDACLYCRKRRIRCSATKPTCQHCAKLGRECVYDNGKPISRVKQLEDKVEQLEKLLTGGPAENSQTGGRRESAESARRGAPPLIHHSSSGNSTTSMNSALDSTGLSSQQPPRVAGSSSTLFSGTDTLDITMLDAFNAIGQNSTANIFPTFGTSLLGSTSAGMEAPVPLTGRNSGQPNESLFDFSTLDPGFMSLVNSMQSASTEPGPTSGDSFYTEMPATSLSQRPDTFDGLTSHQHTNTGIPDFSNASPSAHSSYAHPSASGISSASISDPSPNGQALYHAHVPSVNESSSTMTDKDFNALLHATGVQHPADADTPPQKTPSWAQPHGQPRGPQWSHAPKSPGKQWILGVTESSLADQPAGPGTSGYNAQPSIEQEAFTLVGGWFDAADLPKVARDHLLELFFSSMRLFGQEFHVPRFMASLTLPPAKRPHPCLLYSMYTMASRISTSPSISQLEPHFYSIASRQLEEAIMHADRLLDACRASTILAVYKFSKARYHEGWMMTGQAARLAISCGLHHIQSSVFKPVQPSPNADLEGMMRHRSYVLPPAKDPIEHAERIWAFWSIYICDRCGSISTQWPPVIADDVITTPFPRPLFEYELGLVSKEDDVSISSIFNPPCDRKPLMHYSESSLINVRLRAMTILERSSKLMYLDPEKGWDRSISLSSSRSPPSGIDDYLFSQIFVASAFDSPTGENISNPPPRRDSADTGNKLWTKCAKIRTPKAYEEVKQALLRIEDDLPVEWRTNWTVWDGKLQDWHFTGGKKDLITLHFVLGCAWMFMEDVFAFNAENTISVNIAMRLTATVRFVSAEVMTSELDVFIAMTWSFVSKILIREMKRLHSVGNPLAAKDIEADIDVLVQALRNFGQRYAVGAMQAMRTDRYRNSTAAEFKFMQKDEDEDEDD